MRTALEVTEFTISEQRTRGQVAMGRLVHRLRTELTPIVRERHLGLVRLVMNFESQLVPPSRQIGRAFLPVEEAIRAQLLSAPPTIESYTAEVAVQLPWSPFRPRLSFAPAAQGLGAFGWIITGNAWRSAHAAMDFLQRTSENKATQVAGLDQAILGVVRTSLEVDAEDFTEALAAGALIGPWGRIYLVDVWREVVVVVAEADGWTGCHVFALPSLHETRRS